MEILYKSLPTLEHSWPSIINIKYNQWLPVNPGGYKMYQTKHLLDMIGHSMFGCIGDGIKVDSRDCLLVSNVMVIKHFSDWNIESAASFTNECIHRAIDLCGVFKTHLVQNWVENVRYLSMAAAMDIAKYKASLENGGAIEFQEAFQNHFLDERRWQTSKLVKYMNGEVGPGVGTFSSKNNVSWL
jgi:hypothetical protein